MDAQSRDIVTWVLGTLVSLSILVGLATRYVLFPWLQDKLVGPLQETRRQVADNGHTDQSSPTIPDRLADLSEKVDQATAQHSQHAQEMKAITRVVDEHLRWSDRWVDVIDRELQLVKDQLAHRRNGEQT